MTFFPKSVPVLLQPSNAKHLLPLVAGPVATKESLFIPWVFRYQGRIKVMHDILFLTGRILFLLKESFKASRRAHNYKREAVDVIFESNRRY